MHQELTHPYYICPKTKEKLQFTKTNSDELIFHEGLLKTTDNEQQFEIKNGLPDLRYPPINDLAISDKQSIDWYLNNAEVYDDYLPLTFETFNCDEEKEREHLVDLLELNGNETILEFGCGTGRDSEIIMNRLSDKAKLFLQDISPEILQVAINKLQNKKDNLYFSLANGYHLPFKDNFFDRIFHFGGLNTFGDIKRTFKEIIRVSKVGAKVVIGDENMPIWLRETEQAKILMNSNPHYKFQIPFHDLPIEARKVKVEWIIGGFFYVISFEVGEGEPYADLDFPIPGRRGGTHRTRYKGHIEGVSEEVKAMAFKAQQSSGKSMHQWLNDAIKKACDTE